MIKELKHVEIIKHFKNGLIKLKNSINRKEIPENENPEKIYIVQKILNFNNQ